VDVNLYAFIIWTIDGDEFSTILWIEPLAFIGLEAEWGKRLGRTR
jgi:hypothetical protein